MTTRFCVYKGCQNYIPNPAQDNAISLFKFPKNPERRKKWMELGQAPENLVESSYFYCSNHFERKFLSVNKRRTLLVGEAIPIPYEEQNCEEFSGQIKLSIGDNGETYVLLEPIKNKQIKVESTTTQDINNDNINEDIILNDTFNDPFIIEECSVNSALQESSTRGVKRNISSSDDPLKRKLFATISSTQEDIIPENENFNTGPNAETDNSCITNPINTEHVSIFTFKGEEFVQMSKHYYINEKTEFLKKIQRLECVLCTIKEQISTIDF